MKIQEKHGLSAYLWFGDDGAICKKQKKEQQCSIFDAIKRPFNIDSFV